MNSRDIFILAGFYLSVGSPASFCSENRLCPKRESVGKLTSLLGTFHRKMNPVQ